jgi:hypothetical protein
MAGCSVKWMATRQRRGGEPSENAPIPGLACDLASLITSIKPYALCDSCIALDIHVSHADAHAAAMSAATGDSFERTLRRCHRCGRTVEATAAR